MKNLILGFLVFITILSKGQSVNPETFPTVVGAIGSKNLYTNTGGEGKISIQSIIDSAKLISADFIPLTGTEVGKPVTGDIYLNSELSLKFPSGVDDSYGMLFSEQGAVGIYAGDSTNFIIGGLSVVKDAVAGSTIIIFDNTSNPNFKGLSGSSDYTVNITDLDYTQKIYVDTKVAKIGTDDIEITDFNKGIILTSPNSSRYRITVDNAGNLITTLIP